MEKAQALVNQALSQLNKDTSLEQQWDAHQELIKIISRYQHCYGWTLLIAPNHLPNKATLKAAGLNLEKVLIVHKKNCPDVLFSAYQAIKNDNCSALVIWEELISTVEWQLLTSRVKNSSTKLYLLNNKTHDHAIKLH
jgi:cell division inhibitor SulA